MLKLILTTQAQGKVAYEFAERSITIGRVPDNMLVIEDPSHQAVGASRFRKWFTVSAKIDLARPDASGHPWQRRRRAPHISWKHDRCAHDARALITRAERAPPVKR